MHDKSRTLSAKTEPQPTTQQHLLLCQPRPSSLLEALMSLAHGTRPAAVPRRAGVMTPAALSIVKLLGVSLINLPLSYAAPLFARSDSPVYAREEPDPKSPDDPQLWVYLSIAIALVLLGGVFAGLTIALMGQDEIYLQVIATSGEGSEKKSAARVLRLLKKGKHWVLVTLLLSNVITNETLPIVLDRSLGGGWPAVLSSTVLIGIYVQHPLLCAHTLTSPSHLRRGRPSVHLCPLRSPHWRCHVTSCPRPHVDHGSSRLAYC
jgi:hypothetical protein